MTPSQGIARIIYSYPETKKGILMAKNGMRKTVAKMFVNTVVLPALVIAVRKRIFKLIDENL
jgi:hypothetical protein